MFNNRKATQAQQLSHAQQPQPIPSLDPEPLNNATILTQALEEEIRLRAYELYEQRGRQDGFHEQDWSQAQAEILAREAGRNAKQAA